MLFFPFLDFFCLQFQQNFLCWNFHVLFLVLLIKIMQKFWLINLLVFAFIFYVIEAMNYPHVVIIKLFIDG